MRTVGVVPGSARQALSFCAALQGVLVLSGMHVILAAVSACMVTLVERVREGGGGQGEARRGGTSGAWATSRATATTPLSALRCLLLHFDVLTCFFRSSRLSIRSSLLLLLPSLTTRRSLTRLARTSREDNRT